MLEQAKLHESQIQDKYIRTFDDPKYMYYHLNDSAEAIEFRDTNWSKLQYASVNEEGEVVGYFACFITRQARNAYDISIIKFEESNVFSIDLMRFFDLLFFERNFNKASFEVVIGNPVESMYDKFINRYGGKIVGIKEKETVLRDGKHYDLKMYEIMREAYCKNRKRHGKSTS